MAFNVRKLLIVILLPTLPLIASDKKPKPLQEIILDPTLKNTLSQDLPARKILLDSQENAWILGTKLLWKWVPKRSQVLQIKLSAKTPPLKLMEIRGDHVFASDDEHIYQVDTDSLQTTRFGSPLKNSLALGLIANTHALYWVKTDGIYELNNQSKTLQKILIHNFTDEENAKFLYIPTTKTLWILRDHELSYASYGNKNKPIKFGKIEKNIDDIQQVHNDIFAISRTSIHRYTKRGKLMETIPVSSTRRLVLSHFQPNTHAFIFHDRLLELHLPIDKRSFHFYLDIGKVHKADAMSLNQSLLGLVLDGTPRLFQVSKGSAS